MQVFAVLFFLIFGSTNALANCGKFKFAYENYVLVSNLEAFVFERSGDVFKIPRTYMDLLIQDHNKFVTFSSVELEFFIKKTPKQKLAFEAFRSFCESGILNPVNNRKNSFPARCWCIENSFEEELKALKENVDETLNQTKSLKSELLRGSNEK